MKRKKPNKRAKVGRRVFDTLKAADVGMGLSEGSNGRLRALGADGYHGSRVREAEVLAWMSANPDKCKSLGSDASLKDQKLAEDIRKARHYNDVKEGRYLLRSWVQERFAEYYGIVDGSMEQKLVAEAPALLAGLEMQQVRARLKNITDEVRENAKKSASVFLK